MGPGHGGNIGAVKWWRNLDHVAADHIDPTQSPETGRRLGRGQPAPDRRAGAGRKGRIKAVDVECYVAGIVAHDLAGAGRADAGASGKRSK